MKNNRAARIIFGVIVLIAFIISLKMRISVSPHSDDLDENGVLISETKPAESAKEDKTESSSGANITFVEPAPSGENGGEGTDDPDASPADVPPDPNSPAGRAAALGLPAPPEIDITEWQYLLVNKSRPLGADYAPPEMAYLNMTVDETDIQTAYNGYRCPVDSRIAQPLLDMAMACKAAGNQIYLSSGYRSYNEQNTLLQNKLTQYSYEEAITIVAEPGTSEHQSGLACDITDYYRQFKDSSLENTATYMWLKEHCTEYGFVVRYPADKSGGADTVTGIIYEPWHFRYVGVEAAVYMTQNNLCLEEFVALYE